MSEAMSSVEIEDVLSSIRRLVSEDLRPGLRPVPAAKMVEKPQTDEKLLLTPALRVVPQTEPEARPAPLPRLHLGAGPVAQVAASTLERAVSAQSTEWESEVGDPPLIIAEMEWTEDGWVAPTAQVVSLTPKPAEPTPPWAQDDPGPEPVVAAHPEPIAEPDRHWADRAEAEAVAELTIGEPVDGDMSFDEAVLRELVRDLILAELQGKLGERITRNIRKMVRAEIARAIAVHGVE